MMITIHGLPPKSKYQDVKVLIKQECNINDFILDNLVAEPNGCKKVRVGLTDDDDGYRLMKCLDRYRCSGNFVLSVLPVGKPSPQSAPMLNTYDSREGFQSQRRNDYQQSSNYANPGAPGPHGSNDVPSRSQWAGNNQNNQWNNATMSSQVPQNSFGYQQNPTAIHQNPPFHQQHLSHPVQPEIRSGTQGRGPQEQNFGFNPKPNVPDIRPGRQESRTHVLRSVELLDAPSNPSVQVQGRYPPNNQPYQSHEKPMTIMKDNFQGPSSYMAANNQQQGHFQGQGHGPGQGHSQTQPWSQTLGQQLKQPFPKPTQMQYEKPYNDERKYPPVDSRPNIKSNEPARIPQDNFKKYDKSGLSFSSQGMEPPRRHSPSGRSNLPSDSRISPSGRGISAPGRRVSPSGRRVSPSGRRVSPPGRVVSATGRRISPPGRVVSATGRRISPSGRGISPAGRVISASGRGSPPPGRRLSPPGRRTSPSGRGLSPPGRRISPSNRRMVGRGSPARRLPSPTRRDPQRSTMPLRYSPSRHQDKAIDKYGNDSQNPKQVRPAYEPTVQAPNKSMYSYRPNIHENVQYPIPGTRQVELSSWQQERDKAMYTSTMKKMEEERRDVSRAQVRGAERMGEHGGSPRASRSPLRRERSPLRDRFKRHSPSPRSPRRSWALEKRRSIEPQEAPPPPLWTRTTQDDDFSRPEFPPRIDKDEKKHVIPPWERPNFDKDEDDVRRPVAEERPYGEERGRMNILDREPAHAIHADRFPPQNTKVPEYTREDFERERRGDFRRQNDADRKREYIDKRDFREPPRPIHREDRHRPEPVSPRRESPLRNLGPKEDFRKIDRNFEDIYKKAVEFKKKTDELRKSGERKREGYSVEERGRRDDESKYYEHRREAESSRYHDNRDDRHDYRSEADRHARRADDSPERSRPTNDHHEQDNAPKRKRLMMPPAVKVKRDKAVEELSKKVMEKHLDSNLNTEQKLRIREELRLALSRILFEMFGEMDVSFIEIIVKYQAKYNEREEHKILRDVMSSMPSQYRNSLKRPAAESSAIPPKSSRWSPPANMKKDGARPAVYAAKPKLHKENEDFKKDITGFRPKPQRVKSETNPDDRARSISGDNKLGPRIKYEIKAKPRIRPDPKMRPEPDQKLQPKNTRPKQIVSSETIADNNRRPVAKVGYKLKSEAKSEPRMKLEPKPELKIKPDAKPERKMKPEANADFKKPETKPEIKENIDSVKSKQKLRLENKMKPEIIKSVQRVNETKPEQKAKPEIISEQKVKSESLELDQKLKVEQKTIASFESINDGDTSIEDIIEEHLPVSMPSGGHYELNPLMTRMVEAELQDIMIKVWQELSDNSHDDGEKLVADKLRNVAGDDIKNALGLNVTKRLLNVYNPLFVKIQFSGKPDRENLATFLRKYNFIAFKRIGQADVFAAQMKTIKDFDRICTAKDIMCGDVKLTVSPCYRFTKCPVNLKTAFDDKIEDEEKEETASPNVAKSQNIENDASMEKTVSVPTKSEANVASNKPTNVYAAKSKADSAEAHPKTIESKEHVTKTPTKSEINVHKLNPVNYKTNTPKTVSNTTAVTINTTKNNPSTPLTKSIVSNTEQNNTSAKLNDDTQSKPTKDENKVIKNKLTTTNKSNITDNDHSKKNEVIDGNDNEKFNENDMFALISEGIVLDECSGSDEE